MPQHTYSFAEKQPTYKRLWRWTLELLAGILLLLVVCLGGMFLWLNSETSQDFIQRWLDHTVAQHLGQQTRITFARTAAGLRWNSTTHTPEIILRLDEVAIRHQHNATTTSGVIPQLSMLFDIQQILQQRYIPTALHFHDAHFPLNFMPDQSSNIAQRASYHTMAQQHVMPFVLWWLTPTIQSTTNSTAEALVHMLQQLPPSLVPAHMHPILIDAVMMLRQTKQVKFDSFRLLTPHQNIPLWQGDIVLNNGAYPSFISRFTHHDPTLDRLNISGDIALRYRDDGISTSSTLALHKDWLDEWLEQLATTSLDVPRHIRDSFIAPDAIITLQAQLVLPHQKTSGLLRHVLDSPLALLDDSLTQVSLDMRWPAADPQWHVQWRKTTEQALRSANMLPSSSNLRVNSLQPVPLSLIETLLSDDIFATVKETQENEALDVRFSAQTHWLERTLSEVSLTLQGASSSPPSNLHITSPSMRFAEAMTAPVGQFAIRGNTLPLEWIAPAINPQLAPLGMSLKRGMIDTLQVQGSLDHDQWNWQGADVVITDLHGTLVDGTLEIPALNLVVLRGSDAQPDFGLNITTPFVWNNDVTISDLFIQGNPSRGFRGVTGFTLTEPLWQRAKINLGHTNFGLGAPLTQELAAIDLRAEAELNIRFSLEPQNSQPLQILHVNNQSPVRLKIAEETIDVATLRYQAASNQLTLMGQLMTAGSGGNFSLDLMHNTTPVVTLEATQVPITLIEALLKRYYPLATPLSWQNWQNTGTIDTTLRLTFDDQFALQQLEGTAALGALALQHAQFGPIKSLNEHGTLDISVQRLNPALWQTQTALNLPQLNGKATIEWDATQTLLHRLDAFHWQWQDQEVSLSLQRKGDGLHVIVDTEKFADLQQFFVSDKGTISQENNKPTNVSTKDPFANLPRALLPIARISWQSDRVRFAQQEFDDFAFEATWYTEADANIHTINTLAMAMHSPTTDTDNSADNRTVEQHQLEYQAGEQLMVQSDNFGQFLSALNISQLLRGGQGKMLLTRDHMTPAATPNQALLSGTWQMNNFSIATNSTALRFLEAVSLLGLVTNLNSQDLPFVIMETNISKQGQQWRFDQARAYGPGLSFTFDGTLDLAQDSITGRGTTSPTSILNNFISHIPLLNTLLTGADQGGLIAANYVISGNVKEPTITSQPLSLLSPGVLRSIFGELLPQQTPN